MDSHNIDVYMDTFHIPKEQRETFTLYMENFAAGLTGHKECDAASEYPIRFRGIYDSIGDYAKDRYTSRYEMYMQYLPIAILDAIDWDRIGGGMQIESCDMPNGAVAIFYAGPIDDFDSRIE